MKFEMVSRRIRVIQAFCMGLLLVFAISACAPVLSQAVLEEGGGEVDFVELRLEPDKYLGKIVILGGTVIRRVEPASGQRVEVLQRPLGYRLEPQINDETGGRFLLIVEDTLEGSRLVRQKKITVAAEVIGNEIHPLDETSYSYPVLRLREVYIWPGPYNFEGPNLYFNVHLGGSL